MASPNQQLLDLAPAAGSPPDIVSRLKSGLPAGWFADQTPVLDSVLAGLAAGWAGLFGLLAQAQAQSRIATACGVFLELAAQDYLGASITRRAGEPDAVLRARITAALARPRVTRQAVQAAIIQVTSRPPRIFEPARIQDTGAYNTPATLAYNTAGGWGSPNLPFQLFVHAYRPVGAGVADTLGYGAGPGGYGAGAAQYVTPLMAASQLRDADLAAAIADTLPVATTAWLTISDS